MMIKKVVLALVVASIFFTMTVQMFYIHKLYSNMFRLSSYQVSTSLHRVTTKCKKIRDCNLSPGDILIRRYVTERTRVFDKLAHPYFTHAAFYLGNDKIVEAVGTERKPENEIQIATLSKSDWFDTELTSFVIVRPKYSTGTLEDISKSLVNVANDSDYKFGLPEVGEKRTTCADLIFKQLVDKNIITISNSPEVTTPDYLFSLAMNNPSTFHVEGYSIGK